MSYKLKDIFYLDTSMSTGTSTGDGVASLDVSSYVQPIARGKVKGTGLAIYRVSWDIQDGGGNGPVAAATTGTFRATLNSGSGLVAAAVGSASIQNNTMNCANDLVFSGIDFWAGGTAAGDPHPNIWLTPTKEVPYVVVRDSIQLLVSADVAMNNAADINVRLECATIVLDQATLNQLLRTQTV